MLGFDAIKTEVVARLGNRSDINARVERWINYAFFEILLNPRFSFFELDDQVFFSTITGNNSQSLPLLSPDIWFILDITDLDNSRHLTRSHYQVLDRISGTSGQITRYYRFGMSVFFDPTPDAIYNMRLRFRQRPADLTSGSSIDSLGTEWEEPIVALSTLKGFEALDQMEKATAARQIFEAILPSRQDVPTLEDADAEITLSPVLRYRLG